MAVTTTTRFGFTRYGANTDAWDPADMRGNLDLTEAKAARLDASNSRGAPGVARRLHYNPLSHLLSYDDGSAWAAEYEPKQTWTAYTPALKKNLTGTVTNLASTGGAGRYIRYGNLAIVQGTVTASAGSSGGAGVTLPFPANDRSQIAIGTLGVYGGTVPADQTGLAYLSEDTGILVVTAFSNGYRDIVSGATVRFSVSYEPL